MAEHWFHPREGWSVREAREHMREPLAAQLRRLAATRFYADLWTSDLASKAARVQRPSVEDVLRELPFLTKDELRAAQETKPPLGTHLTCASEDVVRIHRTSGTTGRPLLVALTSKDAAATASHGGQAFRAAGLRDNDIVVHCLNYCMWSGGMTDHTCLEAAGAAVVPFGVGNTETLLDLPLWLPFTALSCTPSYVTFLAERLTDAQRERMAESLRLILVGGEPGGSSAQLRHLAEEAFGARVANANYGLAEVLSIFGSECDAADAMHFHGFPALWPELISLGGDDEPLAIEAGARGELVVTHVEREAQPLVRYRTNDVLEVVATDQCECGRSGFRFRLVGRADDMFVVRGINVFPGALADALAEVSPGLSEFVVDLPAAPPYEVVTLRLEVPAALDESAVAREAEAAIKRRIGCTARVSVVAVGELPRSEGKAQRVIREGVGPPPSAPTTIPGAAPRRGTRRDVT